MFPLFPENWKSIPKCFSDKKLKPGPLVRFAHLSAEDMLNYQHQEQIWPCHKNGQGQPRVIIWKKAPGHGHTITWYKFWQHFIAFIIPIILYQFQKDPFCFIICYDILFYFIHEYKAPRQEETTLVLKQTERSYHFEHWLHLSKNSFALWFYAHFFMILYMYIALGQGRQTIRAIFLCQKEGPHHYGHFFCKFKKNLFNLWLCTHLFMISEKKMFETVDEDGIWVTLDQGQRMKNFDLRHMRILM